MLVLDNYFLMNVYSVNYRKVNLLVLLKFIQVNLNYKILVYIFVVYFDIEYS